MITFDWVTISFALLVICIVLFYLWLRSEGKVHERKKVIESLEKTIAGDKLK